MTLLGHLPSHSKDNDPVAALDGSRAVQMYAVMARMAVWKPSPKLHNREFGRATVIVVNYKLRQVEGIGTHLGREDLVLRR